MTTTDHRPVQSPVRSQGDRPVCVAFAVSAAQEWHAGDDVVRSVEDVIWVGHQVGGIPGREEISVQWALEGLNIHRHASEVAWPYGNPEWTQGRPPDAKDPASLLDTPTWERIAPCNYDEVVKRVEAGAPVVLTIGYLPAAWVADGGWIDGAAGKRTRGNHAVLVVGTTTEPDALLVKNSWGPYWGEDGYGRISRAHTEGYGVVAHALTAGDNDA